MIKFTEIFQGPVVYNTEEERNITTYELREILINPKYVVLIKVADSLQNKTKYEEVPLIEGLHCNTSYTQILLDFSNQSTVTSVIVVGGMDHIAEKITTGQK